MTEQSWPALVIEAPALDDPPEAEELVAAALDDFAPQAIEDLAERPLPPGGLWDPTFPPIPEPPPTPLRWRVFFATPTARDGAAAGARFELALASSCRPWTCPTRTGRRDRSSR